MRLRDMEADIPSEQMTIKFLKLAILYLIAISSVTAAPEAPRLFLTKYTTQKSTTRLEQFIATCRKMPVSHVEEIQKWLGTDEWKRGGTAIVMIRSAGSFVFRQPKKNWCWVIALQADVRHLIVQVGTVNSDGSITVEEDSLRTVENIRIAELLKRQIENYSPRGKKVIDEMSKLLRK